LTDHYVGNTSVAKEMTRIDFL